MTHVIDVLTMIQDRSASENAALKYVDDNPMSSGCRFSVPVFKPATRRQSIVATQKKFYPIGASSV